MSLKYKTCHSCALNITRKSEYCNECYYKHYLFNILAVVHCDGGDYTEKYGIDKSVKKAMKIIVKKIVK